MKKILITLILLFIIIITFSFALLKIGSWNPNHSYFNDNLRYKLDRYPIMRKILGLHFDGDGRSDYLGSNYQKIVIRVFAMKGLEPNQAILDTFSEKVKGITGKPTRVVFQNLEIPFSPSSNLSDLVILLQYLNQFQAQVGNLFQIQYLNLKLHNYMLLVLFLIVVKLRINLLKT